MKYNRDDMLLLLRNNICVVVFTKADGVDMREMKCTLDINRAPEMYDGAKEKTSRKMPNKEVIPVWDLEKKAWRSFRVDSVMNFKVDM